MLVNALRELLGDPRAASFQLMGEDLALLPGAALAASGRAWEEALARLPVEVRVAFATEQAAALHEAHGWLRRYNHSVHGRLVGYLTLGRRCDFEYPWPVVAMVGICQVMEGFGRNRLYGLLGPAARALGLGRLEKIVDASDDVLRRTNRGIFADSVPTVLLGLRAHALRERGDTALAEALIDGPPPPLFDEESQALARGVVDGLLLAGRAARFAALAELTRRHFHREQAIFSHHLGRRREREGALVRRLAAVRSVPAPVVEHGRLLFRPYALPRGFDLRDHDARVVEFTRAFVDPIVADASSYHAAIDYVVRRFGATPA
jgi:hypothetical protein